MQQPVGPKFFLKVDEVLNTTLVESVESLATDKVSSNSNITPGTYPKITFDAKGLVTGGAALQTTDIPALDASKITTGVFDIARIPPAALERLVPVADQNARYALTTESVQLGDTVKQIDTGILYLVVDTSKLDSADGYVVYSAGTAASVPWSGVSSKPTSLSGYGITDGVSSLTTVNGHALSSNVTISKSDVSLGNVLNLEQKVYHGTHTLPSTPTFSGTTVTIPDTTPWVVYIGGARSTISTTKTVDLSTTNDWSGTKANNYGQWFVYMFANLTLGASKTMWDIMSLDAIPCFTVYLQDAGGSDYEGIIANEFHDYRRNLLEHDAQHDSWGAQYVSGFNTLTIGGGVPTVNSFSLLGGVFRDEDLHITVSNPQTQCRIGYRNSALTGMIFDAAGTTYAKQDGSNYPYYDNNGTLTPISNNNYGIYWMYATNRYSTPIMTIMGQGTYSSIANAQAAPQPTILGYMATEWKLLYRIIVRRTTGTAFNWIQSDPMYNLSTGPAIAASAITSISAGNVLYTPTSPDTASSVQSALEARTYFPGGTDVAVTDGGTGASDAATARTNLGVAAVAGSSSQDFAVQSLTFAKKITGTVGSVAAGATITIPDNYTIVQITDDSASAANAVTLPSGSNGQILMIYNGDTQATSGDCVIPSGYIGFFIYLSGWKLLKGIIG